MNSVTHTRAYLIVILAAVYVFLAVAVALRLLVNFDLSSIQWLQTVIPHSLDIPFSVFSLIGSFEITAVAVFAILFLLYRPHHRRELFFLFLFILVIEGLGKEFLYQPGPPHEFSRMVRLFPMPTGSVYTPFSFPSGHAARSAFITLLCFSWVRQSEHSTRTKVLLVLLLVAVEAVNLVSRVYLGEHWSSDVIAGTALGLACAVPSIETSLDPLEQRQ